MLKVVESAKHLDKVVATDGTATSDVAGRRANERVIAIDAGRSGAD